MRRTVVHVLGGSRSVSSCRCCLVAPTNVRQLRDAYVLLVTINRNVGNMSGVAGGGLLIRCPRVS